MNEKIRYVSGPLHMNYFKTIFTSREILRYWNLLLVWFSHFREIPFSCREFSSVSKSAHNFSVLFFVVQFLMDSTYIHVSHVNLPCYEYE